MNSHISKIYYSVKTLKQEDKSSLLYNISSYPNTSMILDDVKKAEDEGLTYEFKNLLNEYSNINRLIQSNPKFNQIAYRDIGIEMIKILCFTEKLNFERCDYVYFRQGQDPVLALKNTSSTIETDSKGISIMINLDLIPLWLYETNIYKNNYYSNILYWASVLVVPVTIIIGAYLFSKK